MPVLAVADGIVELDDPAVVDLDVERPDEHAWTIPAVVSSANALNAAAAR